MEPITFEWDKQRHRLLISPRPETATQEENIRQSARIEAIQGEDSVSRATAEYEMALEAHERREFRRPCTSRLGPEPRFMVHAGTPEFNTVRQGIRDIKGGKDAPVAQAFLEYALRISTIEAYNASECQSLLWTHAMLAQHNPEGDADKVRTLRGLLNTWYDIATPEVTGGARRMQAATKSKNLRWLSPAWRELWGSV